MSLDNEDRKALIAYRQEKADMALDDAAFLTDAGKFGLAANRLYYALYYAASALLLSKGIATKRHSGLMTQIDTHAFCKNWHSFYRRRRIVQSNVFAPS